MKGSSTMDMVPVKSHKESSTCQMVCLGFFVLCSVALAVGLAIVLIRFNEGYYDKTDKGTASGSDGTGSSAGNGVTGTTVSSNVDGTVEPVTYASAFGQYRYASVAADNPICSTIGTDILGRGGSAVDASVATMFCIGLVHCHSTGIGGGNFMTIYEKENGGTEKVLTTLMGREVAPLSATADMFQNKSGSPSTLGGLAIAVPGELRGYYTAWQRFGRLPWKDLVMPAVELARNGFNVGPHLALAIVETQDEFEDPTLAKFPSLQDMLTLDNGQLPVEGDLLKLPKLADTLEVIANEGADAFYNGSLTDDIIADIQEHGGIITRADLETYTADWVTPVNTHLENGDYTVYGPPPPSSGSVIQYILGVLDEYALTRYSIQDTDSSILTYHRIIEAFKFAYGKRSALGDAAFVDVAELVQNMTSDEFAKETKAKILDSSTQELMDYDPAFDVVDNHGTSHLSLLTGEGGAVAQTSTVNLHFGSKSVGSRTGIVLNNEMDDFSTPGIINAFGVPSSPTNYIVPGKRPMSSMSPTIVLNADKEVVFIAGASQGTRIITSTAWAIIRSLWLGLRLDEAINAPRFHHQLLPAHITYPPERWDPAIINGLKAKNHVFEEKTEVYWYGVVQAIYNKCPQCRVHDMNCLNTCVQAVSDFRKGGQPDGY